MGNLNSELLFFTLLIVVFVSFLSFILSVVSIIKYSKLKKKKYEAVDNERLTELEERIKQIGVQSIQSDSSKNSEQIVKMCNDASISKIGIKNFDAFRGMTGAYSFSVAMLDSRNNGIILTSLYGHDSCNTYLRKIEEGNSSITLMNEETEALNIAKNK